MTHTRKRRYVGNVNTKRRNEIETSNNSLPRRFNDMNFLPSPEKPTKPPVVQEDLTHEVMYQPTPPRRPVKEILSENIHAHQQASKNYKLEAWYKSPAGIGSVSNTIAAALSTHDMNQSGYITSDDLITTMKQMNFGLKEREVRELLANHDPKWASNSDSIIHYRTFAKQFDNVRNPEDEKIEDPLTRQERYIRALHQRVAAASQVPIPSAIGRRRERKIPDATRTEIDIPVETGKCKERDRLPPVISRVISEKNEDEKVFSIESLDMEVRTKIPSPTRFSAKNAPGVTPQTKTTLVLGGDMRNTPNSLKRAKMMPQIQDQNHREATRKAKAHIIADHLERINAYAAQADYNIKLTEESKIKATSTMLLRYHQAFFENQTQMTEKVHQRGLTHSDIARHNHNASIESMFHPG